MKYLPWILLLSIATLRIYNLRPDYKNGDYIRISARVSSEPVYYDTRQGIKLEGLWIYIPRYPKIDYGDKITVTGTVKEHKLDRVEVISIEKNNGDMYKIRKKIKSFYDKSLPVPHSSLIAGMTIGSKELIDTKFWEQLKTTGTAHVVVASGMNISLVAGFITNFLVMFVKRNKAVVLSIVGIWTYALLAGFDAPVVRAAIMSTVAFLAVALGRLGSAWRALFVSVYVMIIIWPSWISDLGFILSFGSTSSLMLFERPVRLILERIRLPLIVRADLSTSFAAQILVAPILYFTFGTFNILSPLINVLILWTVVPITIIGGIAGIIGIIVPQLGRLILILTFPLTWWFTFVVQLFG